MTLSGQRKESLQEAALTEGNLGCNNTEGTRKGFPRMDETAGAGLCPHLFLVAWEEFKLLGHRLLGKW